MTLTSRSVKACAGDGEAKAPVRAAAHAAMRAGCSILPIKADGSKAPDCGSWKRFQVQRALDEELARWFGTKGPDKRTGLGLICGGVSNGLEVLDFDEANIFGVFREAAIATGLGELIDRLEAGYFAATPGPGVHLGFRCSTIAGNQKLASRPSPDGKPQPQVLIETRGEGGYIVAAPSNGKVHPTGGRYVQHGGGFETIPTISPEEREALLELARSFDEMPRQDTHHEPHEAQGEAQGERWPDTLTPGADFNARATWANILGTRGWARVYTRADGVELWRRPDKSVGISATIGHGGDLFYPFTTATEFKAGRSYSKFGAVAVLEHGDDFAKAAAALARAGFGTHKRWVRDGLKWKLGTFQNPCPPGHQVAKPGEKNRAAVATEPGKKADNHAAACAKFKRTDLGNAQRLVLRYGDRIRWVERFGRWLVWDGARWIEDDTGKVQRMARRVVRAIAREIDHAAGDDEGKAILKWALASQSKNRLDSMAALARYEKGIAITPDELDRDPWLLNVDNGTLDLRTGELNPHDPKNLITKLAPVPYDPAAKCPRWEQFESEIFKDDKALIRYMRRLVGYSFTGSVREHILVFLYGSGRNGKSVYLNTIDDILGDYATTLHASVLVSAAQEQHPTGLCDLEGKRFAATIEVEDGKRLAEALVKSLTGGDRIKARRMRQDFYEFTPTHKIFLAANHKPEVRGTDEAIWSRIKMIPFGVTFVTDTTQVNPPDRLLRNPDLGEELVGERAGILAAMVRECIGWQLEGLHEPKAVANATKEYRAEMDAIGDFVGERCEVAPSHLREQVKVRAGDLFSTYVAWAKESNLAAISKRRFGTEMERRGFELQKSNGDYWRLGLRLTASA